MLAGAMRCLSLAALTLALVFWSYNYGVAR